MKKNTNYEYAFYSKPLKQVFDNLEDLKAAEAKHFDELKAKEAKAAAKKADAAKVEEAFKALNKARKEYKEKLTQLTTEYSEELTNLKKAFELGKKDIHDALAAAEDTYNTALKEFNAAHPEGYHVTLKDGDFETTISRNTKVQPKTKESEATENELINLFNLLFGF
jgi:chromosome segregation ATPase